MDRLTASPDEILDAELAQLYERRLVVEELIRSLEEYAASEPKRSPFQANNPKTDLSIVRPYTVN